MSDRCYRCHRDQPAGSYVVLCAPHALDLMFAHSDARRLLRKLRRVRRTIERRRLDLEAKRLGYRDLGGESGD